MKHFFTAIIVLTCGVAFAEPCPFDRTKMEFSGTPVEQAKCLLRPVLRGGNLAQPLAKLPEPLESLIGKPVQVKPEQLRKYLATQKIVEEDIGGPLSQKVTAKYFVIHDTSTPNYHEKSIPTNINTPEWPLNNFERWKKINVAHMFVNRMGQSMTWHPFSMSWRATKYESKTLTKEESHGMFVHTEMSQPRRADPKGHPGNDAIAPEPGFTAAQYDRLALLYLAASLEHGTWLVPAYHCCLDSGMVDGHDDPQNFKLDEWARRVGELVKDVNRER
jgi:hypothetical protein